MGMNLTMECHPQDPADGGALRLGGGGGGSVYCSTQGALRTLEAIAACVAGCEPCLLVGETGTGKTSSVQHLAGLLGKKLLVVNVNQQTDASDLLGGYRPVEVSGPCQRSPRVLPMRDMGELCLCLEASNLQQSRSLMACIMGSRCLCYLSSKTMQMLTVGNPRHAQVRRLAQPLLDRLHVLLPKVTSKAKNTAFVRSVQDKFDAGKWKALTKLLNQAVQLVEGVGGGGGGGDEENGGKRKGKGGEEKSLPPNVRVQWRKFAEEVRLHCSHKCACKGEVSLNRSCARRCTATHPAKCPTFHRNKYDFVQWR